MSFSFIFLNIEDVTDDLQNQLNSFTCGVAELDSFLKEEAKSYAEHGITNTTVVWLEDQLDVPAAYFSMSNDVVHLTTSEAFDLGLPFQPATSHFPAVKITKFAVNQKHHGAGLARELMNYVEGMVFTARGMSAVRLLTLDAARRPEVLRFYSKVGFIECIQDARMHREQKRRTTTPMYKDIYVDAPTF